MLFDQNRVDAIIHNWKNQVFSNETIQGVPQRHSTCLKLPIGGFQNLASSPVLVLDAKIFENHLTQCHVGTHFSDFLHHFAFVKLATSCIRVKNKRDASGVKSLSCILIFLIDCFRNC